jgi:hypothetical protein
MNETPETHRQRITEAITPNLTKPIPELLADIHEMSQSAYTAETNAITRTVARFATLLSALSIEADIQTRRILGLTKALVWLTVALFVLTVVLALLTGYLAYDSHLNRERDEQSESSH